MSGYPNYEIERFTRETAKHEMTILHDDGVYRHVKFARPSSFGYWFELVTWPGALAFRGDGEGFIFSRLTDMFQFFRGDRINPDYWSEKLSSGRDSVKEYSEDVFRQLVDEHLTELAEDRPELAAIVRAEFEAAKKEGDDETSEGAHELLSDWEYRKAFSDTWEWDLRDYDWWFLWACHAIQWGIAQYDAAKAVAA